MPPRVLAVWAKTLRGQKSTTTLIMFRSIIDHRQLQVAHDEFEFHLKLQCELTLLHCLYSLNDRETLQQD